MIFNVSKISPKSPKVRLFCYPSLSPKCSQYEAKIDGSYQHSVEASSPPQMSLLGHLANLQ